MKIPINAIEYTEERPVFDLSCTAANDDWIRAARLLKAGKLEELEAMDNIKMHKEI